MKKRYIFLALIFGFILSRVAFAAVEWQSVNVNYAAKTATETFNEGYFNETNSVIANGDTVETSKFISTGEQLNVNIKGGDFTKILGGLIQASAINTDAVTNATIGQTGVAIAGFDTINTDLGNNT